MYKHVFLLVISAFLIISCSNETSVEQDGKVSKDHYRLVIDAGSSGSRIYVYHVEMQPNDKLPEISIIDQFKVEPGVSTFPENREQILSQMGELLKFAESKIDKEHWKSTELHLMATAGMRLLSDEDQENTMKALTAYFKKNSSFDFKEALVLSGQYEGLYGWTALNYLDDRFDPKEEREALLEMGGASTQIAFLADNATKEGIVHRNYAGAEFDLYAKSYLNMGQDRALQIAGMPSCFPKGYDLDGKLGVGDFNKCSEEMVPIFNELCASEENTECLFDAGFQGSSEDEYIAIAAFYYTLDFFGFENTVNLDSLQNRGTLFCGKSWEEVTKNYGDVNPSYLSAYCFNASYFWTLFTKGYGLNNEFVIQTKNDVEGEEISWTLGAVIDLEMGYKPEKF